MYFLLNAQLEKNPPKEKIAYNKNILEISKGPPRAACSPQSPCPLPHEVGRTNVENTSHALTTMEMQHL